MKKKSRLKGEENNSENLETAQNIIDLSDDNNNKSVKEETQYLNHEIKNEPEKVSEDFKNHDENELTESKRIKN